ncbi:hypothetical protein BD408DRAFT_416554 [Parasitella parasitica]|nr:hypothetical protein BD408DRAFT_416554 [Parasitella parasitica]
MEEYNHSLTSPLIAITSALAAAAWLILFIGGCVAAFHGVTWFIIIFELVVVVGIIIILGLGVFNRFREMVYLFMAVSLVYLTWLCQWTLDNNDIGGAGAATAGAVILIIVEFIWAIELTAPGGGTFMSNGSFRGVNEKTAHFGHKFSNAVRPNTNSHDKKPLPRRHDEEVGDAIDTFEQATALHDYQGSPDDPNELSFEKGESLDILDKRGNWWQARKVDGTTGIVPSNYF